MIVRFLLLNIGLLLPCLQALAQSQMLKGYIYDSQSRQPLAGVVLLDNTYRRLTKSDAKGAFEIDAVQLDGKILAVLAGYKNQVIKIDAQENQLNVQMEADGLSLNEVRIMAYSGNRSSKETAGAIGILNLRNLNRGNAMSLQPALNTIPGVRMDQSTLSEARISIRGNGVRAAYGIRNIKVYVNEIPVTEADGTTRIEALDMNSIGMAEVLKGPASSIYGAGTGGVINFQLQRAPYQEQSLELSSLAGSFGLHRLATTYRSGGDKLNSFVSYGWQDYAGYRKHNNDMRRFVTANFQLFPSSQRIITLMLNRTTQHSNIPGSLTAEEVVSNPTQANASNLDKQAGRFQTWTRIGLGQQYQFNDNFSNHTSAFSYFYDLDHPLPYAYIRNFYESYGGRTKFNYDPHFSILFTRFVIGAEFNEGLTKGTQYQNVQGKEGSINSNIDYRNTQYSVFYQSETALAAQTMLVFGLSYNSLNYKVNNYLKQNQSGIKKFKPQASPRLALSQNFSDALSLHASVSSGFSAPSSSEIRDADGMVNSTLQAEKALNYELNAKGNLFKSRLAYDLALFKMDMKGELIAQAVQQGITIYHNAGKTSHNGVELSLSYQLLEASAQSPKVSLRPFAALTYSDFKFKDYKKNDAQGNVIATFDGNKLTGIAPWVLNLGVDLESRIGLYFYGSYFYNDRLPVNDANSVYSPSYDVLNIKCGYRKKVLKYIDVNVYGGVDNLLDRNYSSLISLNAIGYNGAQPAYFNPSPTISGYGGLNIKYIF